jgi:beta-glucosidase
VGDAGARAARLAASADVAVIVVGSTRDDEGEYIGDATPDVLRQLLPGPDDPERVAEFEAYRAQVDWPPTAGYGDRAMGQDVGGDRRTLALIDTHRDLVASVCAANPRTLVVVMGATAALMSPVLTGASAVMFVFYPGLEGGRALADVLVGDSEPAGRLPFALPRRAEDLVDFDATASAVTYGDLHGQWYLDATGASAAVPFGFGLGWGLVEILGASIESDGVRCRVANPGARSTSTVVFCHARRRDGSGPWKLVGFARVKIEAHRDRVVDVDLSRRALARYDVARGALVEPEGSLEIEVGRYARDPGGVVLAWD